MNKVKKHIVIVTTWFPPLQGVAVNRLLAFAKYLNNYDVSVVTIGDTDNSLETELPKVAIYRINNDSIFTLPTFTRKTSKLVHYLKVIKKIVILKFFKGGYSSWEKNAFKKIQSIHKDNPVDVILSSYAPIAPHEVALKFCKLHPNVKWIADMRDELSKTWGISKKEQAKLEKIEARLNKRMDALTAASKPALDTFRKDFDRPKYFLEVRNGFDHEVKPRKNHFNEIFTISFLGTMYGEIKPKNLFSALLELHSEGILPAKFEINFIGSQQNFHIPKALISHIKIKDRVPQIESIKIMAKSDVNLLILPNLGRKGVFSAKIFDYISVKKPILAIIDKADVAAELIRDTNSGIIAEFDNIPEIKDAFMNCYNIWKNKEVLSFKNVESLHRKIQVKKIEELIEKLHS